MPVYPGDPKPSFENYKTLAKDGVNLTRLVIGSHTGTHIDAPAHFIPGGIGIDRIPPDRLVGEAVVVDFSMIPIGGGITASHFQKTVQKILPNDIVVCYTGCSDHWGEESMNTNYTYITKEAADYLVSKKVRAVGIDFLSVERFDASDAATHKTLLSRGIFIIESLGSSLKRFVGERILMVCMPIKLQNGDGAPARVIGVPIVED